MARKPDRLAVWWEGLRLGRLESLASGWRFTYSLESLNRFPLNSPLVSISMPTRTEAWRDRFVHPFFDGLLPEGDLRTIIAFDLSLNPLDSFALLRALGKEGAGALSLQEEEAPAPRPQPVQSAGEPLSDAEIDSEIQNLSSVPLGVEWGHKVTLAGQQSKLMLVKGALGQWFRPAPGVPTTHIFKPAGTRFPAMVPNEALCQRLALSLGLPAASVDVARHAERDVLIVERFDRYRAPDGSIRRLHQEDLCQALSIRLTHGAPRSPKYEQWGGPSLRTVARLLESWAPAHYLQEHQALLRLAVLNTLIGNSNSHAKNISLQHAPDGSVHLAPAYDLMATCLYPTVGQAPEISLDGVVYASEIVDRIPGMYVNGINDLDSINPQDLIAEAQSWGMALSIASAIVAEVIERAPQAISAAASLTPQAPSELVALLQERSSHLLAALAADGPSVS